MERKMALKKYIISYRYDPNPPSSHVLQVEDAVWADNAFEAYEEFVGLRRDVNQPYKVTIISIKYEEDFKK
jgi:hypothetical protein